MFYCISQGLEVGVGKGAVAAKNPNDVSLDLKQADSNSMDCHFESAGDIRLG